MADIQLNRFSIRDIENLTGIKAHTIRIWEQRYGILQPKRTDTNIRYYDADDLKVALRISLLNNHGYKISRIHQMSAHDMSSLIQKINDSGFKLQLLVSELLEATLAMDIDLFEELLNGYLKKNGVEDMVEQLIFQYLEKIGMMWMTDRIFPAQEHLISNVIYRKLAVAIETLPPKQPDAGPKVLLFLPEGELHDIGLMYIYYMLLKNGKAPIYLGPNTPLQDALLVYTHMKPEYVYIHLTAPANEFDVNKYVYKLEAHFKDSTVLLSGGAITSKKIVSRPHNVKILKNLEEVRNVLSDI
ncbi:MAG: MerR family transcriptional regulator [Flavipsychrobacter sp.]|nr:MerR family transcriptional regulator [Flavipsychrobacter sp.]